MRKGYSREQLKQIILAYETISIEEMEKSMKNITRLFIEELDRLEEAKLNGQ